MVSLRDERGRPRSAISNEARRREMRGHRTGLNEQGGIHWLSTYTLCLWSQCVSLTSSLHLSEDLEHPVYLTCVAVVAFANTDDG